MCNDKFTKIMFFYVWLFFLGGHYTYGAQNVDRLLDDKVNNVKNYLQQNNHNENSHCQFVLDLADIQNICNNQSNSIWLGTSITLNNIIKANSHFANACDNALFEIEYLKNPIIKTFANGYAQLRCNSSLPDAKELAVGTTIERHCSAVFRLGLHCERNPLDQWKKKKVSVKTATEAVQCIVDLKLILMPNKDLEQIQGNDTANAVNLITEYLKAIKNGLECEDQQSEIKEKVKYSHQNIHDFLTVLTKNTNLSFFIAPDQSTTIITLFNDIIKHEKISNLRLKQIEVLNVTQKTSNVIPTHNAIHPCVSPQPGQHLPTPALAPTKAIALTPEEEDFLLIRIQSSNICYITKELIDSINNKSIDKSTLGPRLRLLSENNALESIQTNEIISSIVNKIISHLDTSKHIISDLDQRDKDALTKIREALKQSPQKLPAQPAIINADIAQSSASQSASTLPKHTPPTNYQNNPSIPLSMDTAHNNTVSQPNSRRFFGLSPELTFPEKNAISNVQCEACKAIAQIITAIQSRNIENRTCLKPAIEKVATFYGNIQSNAVAIGIIQKLFEHQHFKDMVDACDSAEQEFIQGYVGMIQNCISQSFSRDLIPQNPTYPNQQHPTHQQQTHSNLIPQQQPWLPTTPIPAISPQPAPTPPTTNKTPKTPLTSTLQKTNYDNAIFRQKQKDLANAIKTINEQYCFLGNEQTTKQLNIIQENLVVTTVIDKWKIDYWTDLSHPLITTIRTSLSQQENHTKDKYQRPIETQEVGSLEYANAMAGTVKEAIYYINNVFFAYGCNAINTGKFIEKVVTISNYLKAHPEDNTQENEYIKLIGKNEHFQSICFHIINGRVCEEKELLRDALTIINTQLNLMVPKKKEVLQKPAPTNPSKSFLSSLTPQKLLIGGTGIFGVIAFIAYMAQNNPSFLDRIPFFTRLFGSSKA